MSLQHSEQSFVHPLQGLDLLAIALQQWAQFRADPAIGPHQFVEVSFAVQASALVFHPGFHEHPRRRVLEAGLSIHHRAPKSNLPPQRPQLRGNDIADREHIAAEQVGDRPRVNLVAFFLAGANRLHARRVSHPDVGPALLEVVVNPVAEYGGFHATHPGCGDGLHPCVQILAPRLHRPLTDDLAIESDKIGMHRHRKPLYLRIQTVRERWPLERKRPCRQDTSLGSPPQYAVFSVLLAHSSNGRVAASLATRTIGIDRSACGTASSL